MFFSNYDIKGWYQGVAGCPLVVKVDEEFLLVADTQSDDSSQYIRFILCLENSIRSISDRTYFKVKYFQYVTFRQKIK